MIVVDTSVWIDFLRGTHKTARLATLLEENRVASHAWIIAELAMGHLGPKRKHILHDLDHLPQCTVATIAELRDFADREKLAGSGLSLVDAQLLYSAIQDDYTVWSLDPILQKWAKKYHVAFATKD